MVLHLLINVELYLYVYICLENNKVLQYQIFACKFPPHSGAKGIPIEALTAFGDAAIHLVNELLLYCLTLFTLSKRVKKEGFPYSSQCI